MVVEDNDINRIEKAIERLEQKIDAQDDKYMTRIEFEARHGILQNDVNKLAMGIQQQNTLAISEHDSIRKETAARFERVSDTLDKISKDVSLDIQKIRTEIQKVSTDKWKLVAMTLIGALTSGGILALIDAIRNLTGH